ncbi:accessory gene regulator B [Anaerosolibacter carboniphilus]|uniref:Accessory gene regulator B n=1 Tax=Anaerosolibacter carboniphilus TaxID=1417629 RepID=A0A841KPV0_9FIRM|nr:accessory gene regulator B family protein [Anaerosolibacter carboniphilus]MBB6215496.1 accessory gene regulator B [Anaerosolibacter carboniphilus]
MYLIEKLSNRFASQISVILGFDKDYEEILAYGAFAILHILWSILLITVFGILFGVLLESLIISFTASILRKYSGGVHATSPNRCATIGTIIFVGFSVAINQFNSINLVFALIFHILSFIYAYYIISRYCPVDTPNKPIIKQESKERLRKKSFQFIHLCLICSVGLFILYFQRINYPAMKLILAICIGLVWQSFTLTRLGHLIISNLDILLAKTSFITGGDKR